MSAYIHYDLKRDEECVMLRGLLKECVAVLNICVLALDTVEMANPAVTNAENAISALLAKLPNWSKK